MCRSRSFGPSIIQFFLFLSILLLTPATTAAALPEKPYTVRWQLKGTANLKQPPVISPWGDIFLFTGNGVQRLDDQGRQIWQYNTPEGTTSGPVFFKDGSTFVATGKALYEIKPYGRAGWRFTIPTGEKGSSAQGSNLAQGPGDTFYLLLGSTLYAVAPRRNMIWYLGQSDYPVAVDADRRYVYVARNKKDAGTTLAALDAGGATVWQRGLAEQKQLYLTLSPDKQYLFVVSIPKTIDRMNKAALYTLDATTGNTVWSRRYAQNELSNITIGPDGLLYLVAGKRYLYALDPATGREVLSNQLLDLSGAAPVVDRNGTIFIPGQDCLYTVSRSTGRLIWYADFPGGIPTTPTLGRDGLTVYLTDGQGSLYALQNNYGGTLLP
ncbi:PQQ-binding-like beta-propeller repeat protein [Moorella sp. Hama-1]|uniref:outer membrane protein assembly factor BamB family protein n=1 Tax=Moorella sp. Hama-1 TaxID=2138101 RepID=UPI000D65718B|nr:PQQ-binding-like beta-propeller repeat protein [Moorella sp. Hama-1]BCV22959.1 hypothetical protein hamaS1_30280 [Moorella sp. Hama-1]